MWRESFVQTNCEVHLLKVLPPLYDVLPLYVQSTLSRVYTHPYPRNPRTQHDRLHKPGALRRAALTRYTHIPPPQARRRPIPLVEQLRARRYRLLSEEANPR